MSEVKKIYLDMDGVLADFEGRWRTLFGEHPRESRDRKNFSPNWENFIKEKNFATLDTWPGSVELLQFVFSLGDEVEIEILSSSGGKKFHDAVSEQKTAWLDEHGLGNIKANFVPGRGLKKDFANENSVLIDDTQDVIEAFSRAGGKAILHRDADETIRTLKGMLNANTE